MFQFQPDGLHDGVSGQPMRCDLAAAAETRKRVLMMAYTEGDLHDRRRYCKSTGWVTQVDRRVDYGNEGIARVSSWIESCPKGCQAVNTNTSERSEAGASKN